MQPSMTTSCAKSGSAELPNDFLTIQEAADYLRVGRRVIDAAIQRRRLPVVQLTATRRVLRIYRPDLLKLRATVS